MAELCEYGGTDKLYENRARWSYSPGVSLATSLFTPCVSGRPPNWRLEGVYQTEQYRGKVVGPGTSTAFEIYTKGNTVDSRTVSKMLAQVDNAVPRQPGQRTAWSQT